MNQVAKSLMEAKSVHSVSSGYFTLALRCEGLSIRQKVVCRAANGAAMSVEFTDS